MDSVQYSFPSLNKNGTIPEKFKPSVKVAAQQLERSAVMAKGCGPAMLGSDAESDDEPRVPAQPGTGPSTKKNKRGEKQTK